MGNFQGIFPIVGAALVIAIQWRRTTDVNVKIYSIKKKHWYAMLEGLFLMAAVVLMIKNLN